MLVRFCWGLEEVDNGQKAWDGPLKKRLQGTSQEHLAYVQPKSIGRLSSAPNLPHLRLYTLQLGIH